MEVPMGWGQFSAIVHYWGQKKTPLAGKAESLYFISHWRTCTSQVQHLLHISRTGKMYVIIYEYLWSRIQNAWIWIIYKYTEVQSRFRMHSELAKPCIGRHLFYKGPLESEDPTPCFLKMMLAVIPVRVGSEHQLVHKNQQISTV